jgi:serine/threonine protein phosphatase PrpC
MLGVLSRINGEIFARSASHDDYVTAGCSLSAILVVHGRAYVLHTGGTAAYLAHSGTLCALTRDDTLDEGALPLLARALGTSGTLDVSVSSVAVEAGDVIVLTAHRVPGDVDRRTLIAHVERAGPGEHVLVVRFDDGDRAIEDLLVQITAVYAPEPLVRVAIAAVGALLMFSFTFAWAQ